MERIVTYFLLLHFTCPDSVSTFTAKQTKSRLDYMEARLNAESGRLNAESKFWKEEFSVLFNKLESIEALLHTVIDRNVAENVGTTISEQNVSMTNQRLNILFDAFKIEKFENKRFKRELLKDFNKQSEQTKEAFERVEGSLGHIAKEISELKEKAIKQQVDCDKKGKYMLQKIEENARVLKFLVGISKQTVNIISQDLIDTRETLEQHVNLQTISQAQCIDVSHNLTKKIENLEKIVLEKKPTFIEKKYKSCLDFLNNGFKSNGIYKIEVDNLEVNKKELSVYCDMTTDNGGWTVFQRRQDGSVNFSRDWNDYKYGFGRLDGEFWLGNRYINILTDDDQTHELRIDLEDHEENRAYAKYSKFKVGSENTNYILEVSGYIGDAGDSLENPENIGHIHNGMQFSTKDRDNDKSAANCAVEFNGGWWFNICFASHLNGLYHNYAGCNGMWECIVWNTWKGPMYTLKFTEMKLR